MLPRQFSVGPVRVLAGLVMLCVMYDLAVYCGVFMTIYGSPKPTCESARHWPVLFFEIIIALVGGPTKGGKATVNP